jgi:predicted neuraminidase
LAIVAAVGGICWAAALKQPFEFMVAPAGDNNPRNSEADMLQLKDGRLMLAWIDFQGAGGSDWAKAVISAMYSRDQGRTRGVKVTLQENIGEMNVMEPDLLRLRSGKVLFLFCRKNSEADCAPMVRLSTDDARTFSAPRPMPITPSPSYTGFNHDRAIQLKSGRILMPVFYTPDYRIQKRILTRVYISDNEGADWKPSTTIVDIPESKAGAQEPGVIELKDGRVLMWIRNSTGKIYKCYSKDAGETWSTPEPMNVQSPLSPQSIKRHPKTGDLLLVWNNSPDKRYPLTAATSRDEGETWTRGRDLDTTPDHTFAYTSIEFLKDRALFTYYVGPPAGSRGQWSLKLKAVPLDWFYRK